MNRDPRVIGAMAVSTVAFIGVAGAAPITKRPDQTAVITPQQIEADWLRQEELRERPVVAGKGKDVKPEQDALGGVDGIRTGQWGFHTENELNPWWQVDLG
ncbi:MAG: hypothetical protein FJ388_15585, partial [Verrucomicrobia bacterium]|nr:hypothetical protein [Verrucomicrobiota bacterium]